MKFIIDSCFLLLYSMLFISVFCLFCFLMYIFVDNLKDILEKIIDWYIKFKKRKNKLKEEFVNRQIFEVIKCRTILNVYTATAYIVAPIIYYKVILYKLEYNGDKTPIATIKGESFFLKQNKILQVVIDCIKDYEKIRYKEERKICI